MLLIVRLRARLAARIRDERGVTMVEALVSTATGVVVLAGLTMVILVTMHSNSRVSARVDATQQARLVVTKLMQQLHSACVAPKIAPILAPSSGTLLRFIHAAPDQGDAVAPLPTVTEISLANGVLTQTDRPAVGGAYPNWDYSTTTTSKQLLTGVAPIAPSSEIFTYYASNNGSLTPTPQTVPLLALDALGTVQVRIAMTVSPTENTVVDDAGATAPIRDGATLRLTPPSFNEAAPALPCS